MLLSARIAFHTSISPHFVWVYFNRKARKNALSVGIQKSCMRSLANVFRDCMQVCKTLYLFRGMVQSQIAKEPTSINLPQSRP